MSDHNYSSDSPVYSKDQDQFSRWSFSERVAQVISKRNDPSSLVIGLHGIWGDGKTSVLNFIEKTLETDNNVICINFNPWRFGTEEELLTGLFINIAEALDTELISSGEKLKDFIKKVAPGAGAIIGATEAGSTISSFITWPDINELKSRIEDKLDSEKKRVLILIDDVDRLEKSEIHALFKLVKLTADLKYTSYILAFDKDIVSASLQDQYSSNIENAGEAFLEKIIQVPLHLPSIEQQTLREFCFKGIDEALTLAEIELNQQQVQKFVSYFDAFDSCLTTPRKAKLYGNTLLFALPILKGEVNPIDLMLVEGIRIFCPSLYETVRAHKDLLTGAFHTGLHTNNDTEKEHIKSLIDSAIAKDKNINKEEIIGLLKHLFPKVQSTYGNILYGSDSYETWDSQQRVCSANYFSRYFTYAIPKDDIPDQVILSLVKDCNKLHESLNDKNNPLNEYLTEKNAKTLINKMRRKTREINPLSSYVLALAISQKSGSYQNHESFSPWDTPFAQAGMLISNLVQNCSPESRIDLVCQCMDMAPTIEFQLEIFKWLKKEDEDNSGEDVFKEDAINQLGTHLSNNIIKEINTKGDVSLVAPKSTPYIFYLLNKYTHNQFINEHVKETSLHDHSIVVRILDTFTPIAWSMESGIPHKSDFERRHYNDLTEELDAQILIDIIKNHFPDNLNIPEEYPIRFDDKEYTDDLLIKQFVWINRHVLNKNNKDS